MVALSGYGDRLPAELSGGQQQRVALARALAHEPRVLLLDEPFGALDAKIRDELRRSVRDIQRSLGITTVLVTHDQEEAFKMADRIGVMDRGRLQETGSPKSLYARPRTRFVATFLGAANLLLGRYEDGGMRIGEALFPNDEWPSGARPGDEATVVIRPEDIVIEPSRSGRMLRRIGSATVTGHEFAGASERFTLCVNATSRLSSALRPADVQFTLEVARGAGDSSISLVTIGESVHFGATRVHVLPTRINSMRLIGTPAEIEGLRSADLVTELCRSMHITPLPLDPGPPEDGQTVGGLLIARLSTDGDLTPAMQLLERGAQQVLALSAGDRHIGRILIYVQPSHPARDVALSVAGSLLRHLQVEATLLVPANEQPRYGSRYRDLLALRNAALNLHGVDMRTATFDGDVGAAIETQLRSSRTPALLLIGMTSVAAGQRLTQQLTGLLGANTGAAAALLVSARSGNERVPAAMPFVQGASASSR
jgi:sulfate/thiosulfate transport system ATP-binding protein